MGIVPQIVKKKKGINEFILKRSSNSVTVAVVVVLVFAAVVFVVVKVKLATIVEGDPKAPFSIATTPRCRGGRYSIPRIAPLYP